MPRHSAIAALVCCATATASSSRCAKVLPLVELGQREMVLNIGSNNDPCTPPTEPYTADTSAIAVAFEPVLDAVNAAVARKGQSRLFVIPAAVSPNNSLMTMYKYYYSGQSSSFAKAHDVKQVAWGENNGTLMIVPTLSMANVLCSLVANRISYLKTDMQGYDYATVSSAGSAITAIPWLYTELYTYQVNSYEGVKNDFCRDWVPHMKEMGYKAVWMNGGDPWLSKIDWNYVAQGGATVDELMCPEDLRRNPGKMRKWGGYDFQGNKHYHGKATQERDVLWMLARRGGKRVEPVQGIYGFRNMTEQWLWMTRGGHQEAMYPPPPSAPAASPRPRRLSSKSFQLYGSLVVACAVAFGAIGHCLRSRRGRGGK